MKHPVHTEMARIVRALPWTRELVSQYLGVNRATLQGWLAMAEGTDLPPRWPGRLAPTPRLLKLARGALETHAAEVHTALGGIYASAIATAKDGQVGLLLTIAGKKKVAFVACDEEMLDKALGGFARRKEAIEAVIGAEVTDAEVPSLLDELIETNLRVI